MKPFNFKTSFIVQLYLLNEFISPAIQRQNISRPRETTIQQYYNTILKKQWLNSDLFLLLLLLLLFFKSGNWLATIALELG